MTGNKIKNNQGVTLMELVVAMGVFMAVMVMATGIFRMVIEGQRNAIAGQNVQENMRYALEVMAKEIRMAQTNDGSCRGRDNAYTPVNGVFNTNSPTDNVMYFINKEGICTTYEFLPAGQIQITRGTNTGNITPNKIYISNLKFRVDDNPAGSFSVQPKVTILIDAQMAAGKSEHKQEVKLQTTISSRVY